MKPEIPAQDMVTLDMLQAHPENYKIHPQAQVTRVKNSLKAHGQRKPVPVRKTDAGLFIIAGHCVVAAMGELAQSDSNWQYCWVTYVPEQWTDEQAINYLVADNETARGAEDDKEQLFALLTGQQDKGYTIEVLGMTSAEYAKLFDEMQQEVREQPEINFTAEVLESSNYVVLLFSNDLDWLHMQTLYPLPTVKVLREYGASQRSGVGRIVDGAAFIRAIREQTWTS